MDAELSKQKMTHCTCECILTIVLEDAKVRHCSLGVAVPSGTGNRVAFNG